MIFRYLRNTDRYSFLQPQKAQFTVSLSCVLYLQSSLDFIDSRVPEDENYLSVLLCLHELHLYAIDHWVDHLLVLSRSLRSRPGECEIEPLLQGLERLTDMHQMNAALQGFDVSNGREKGSTQQEHGWQVFGISPATRSLLDRVLVQRQAVFSGESWSKEPHCKRTALQCSNLLILSTPAVDPNDNHLDLPLFSRIRSRYQTIVEELMQRDQPDNHALSAFISRQASGAFLCRYRSCTRAAQGFRTSDLREKHEENHRPRFQCAYASCGFFGTTFNSRAAMKRHAAQYHDEECTASVPNSLSRKPNRLLEERSLFAFTEVKAKRRAAGLSPRHEFEIMTASRRDSSSSSAPQPSVPGFPTMPSSLPQIPQQYPFFSKSRRQSSSIRSGSDHVPEFPASLTSMESTKSETDQPEKGEVVPEAQQRLPSSYEAIRQYNRTASSGTYICTFPDCHARFDTAAKLQMHHREAHRASSQYASTPTTPTPTHATGRQLDRTMSDVYQDEMYNPALEKTARLTQHGNKAQANVISPPRNHFSDLLQAANTDHLKASSASPTFDVAQQRSPFRESSQFAMEGAVSDPTRPPDVTRVNPAAQLGQQQELGAYITPKSFSPKDALLDYDNTEEDPKIRLFPQPSHGKQAQQQAALQQAAQQRAAYHQQHTTNSSSKRYNSNNSKQHTTNSNSKRYNSDNCNNCDNSKRQNSKRHYSKRYNSNDSKRNNSDNYNCKRHNSKRHNGTQHKGKQHTTNSSNGCNS